MQDTDRVPHVEVLPQLAGARSVRVKVQPGRLVSRSKRLDGIVGDRGRKGDMGQRSAVRSSETQLAVGPPFYLVSLFVNGTVVVAAEHREVRERHGRDGVARAGLRAESYASGRRLRRSHRRGRAA